MTLHTILFSFILAMSLATASPSTVGGFSIDIIHRDSPKSPFYNASETVFDRVSKALRRSLLRASHFTSLSNQDLRNDQTTLKYDSGEYVMKLSFGTPPFEVYATIDTGSDLTWIQCKGCTSCFPKPIPSFDPSASSTYELLPCQSRTCHSVPSSCYGDQGQYCQYNINYNDKSYSKGKVGVDTVTLSSTNGLPLPFVNTIFGCGYENKGNFFGSGIVGIGRGMASLIFQIYYMTSFKFSYCLVPFVNIPSKMSFGNVSIVSGSGVVSTPLVLKDTGTQYRLTLEAISVGDTRIEFDVSEGNIIIDSGTVMTFVPQDFYDEIEAEVIKTVKLVRTDPPAGAKLCYQNGLGSVFTTLTMHFAGADLALKPNNLFVRFGDKLCFSFAPTPPNGLVIFGSLTQTNFWVGYDIDDKTLSFKPSDCSKP